jgi:hypothetical protein
MSHLQAIFLKNTNPLTLWGAEREPKVSLKIFISQMVLLSDFNYL